MTPLKQPVNYGQRFALTSSPGPLNFILNYTSKVKKEEGLGTRLFCPESMHVQGGMTTIVAFKLACSFVAIYPTAFVRVQKVGDAPLLLPLPTV